MVPAEHATDDDDSSDELGKSLSPCLPLIVFQHQSRQHENEHEMLMFSVSQKRLLLHAADMAPDLVAGSNDMFWPDLPAGLDAGSVQQVPFVLCGVAVEPSHRGQDHSATPRSTSRKG